MKATACVGTPYNVQLSDCDLRRIGLEKLCTNIMLLRSGAERDFAQFLENTQTYHNYLWRYTK